MAHFGKRSLLVVLMTQGPCGTCWGHRSTADATWMQRPGGQARAGLGEDRAGRVGSWPLINVGPGCYFPVSASVKWACVEIKGAHSRCLPLPSLQPPAQVGAPSLLQLHVPEAPLSPVQPWRGPRRAGLAV
jgi:hypothetical protein